MQINGRSPWLKGLLLLIVFSASPGSVSAQTSPVVTDLETILIPGRTVWMTDPAGLETRTRIVSVSGGDITAAAGDELRRLRTTDVRRVRVRASDPVINGAVIGAGTAIASGLGLCSLTETWENCRDDAGPIVRIAALGAGVGLGIDALFRGRRTIYDAGPRATRLSAAPVIARGARGVQVSFFF